VFFAAFADAYAPSEVGRFINPVILSQKLMTNRVALTVWFPALARSEVQDSCDLTEWRSFQEWFSDWTTNVSFNYPYNPASPDRTRFFRTAIQRPHGPP
jgi:hypothetical protein